MVLALFLLAFASPKGIALNQIKTYEALPDSQDLFIQGPGSVCLDDDGRLHVFDFIGRTLFVWDKDGKYIGNYGKGGEGPGELTVFGRMGGPQGEVTAIGDTLFVYDGGSRRLNRFNMDLTFRDAKPFNVEAGRVEVFSPLSADSFAVFYSSFLSETPFRKVAIFNEDKTKEVEILKVKDETWKGSGDGANRKVELIGFAPQVYVTVNHLNKTIVVGDSNKPSFSIFGFDGKLQTTVTTKLVQREVTKELKEEYNSQNWVKNNAFFTTSFPEKRGFYETIIPVGKDRYLLALVSPVKVNMEGYLVDVTGASLGRFTYTCGEGGSLYSSMGRLFGCIVNEDGEFQIVELSPTPQAGGDGQGG